MGVLESIFYMAWRGVAIGLIISAPMGPVGMLCIQRTLDKGRRAGFYTGIGAALSDLFYSLLTGFGLSFIEEFLERNQNVIQIVGSVVLIAFGVYLFRKNPAKTLRKPVEENFSIQKSILGGFLFTFSNPLILFLIIGLFARFNFLLPEFKLYQYFTGFVFIFVGAILWWWFITFSIDKVRHHFNIRSMWLINRIIGVIIMLFAVVGIFTATSALVKGADFRCWNSKRGFEPFSLETDATSCRLNNESLDSLFVMTHCDRAIALEFRAKTHSQKPKNPWGFVLKDATGRALYVDISSVENGSDGISTSPALKVSLRTDGEVLSTKRFSDRTDLFHKIKNGLEGPDPSGSHNFYKLSFLLDRFSLLGGLHSPELLISEKVPAGFVVDSIGFWLSPGASINIDEMRLSTSKYPSPEELTWSDTDLLDEYLSRSSDSMEGYLLMLDRSLDESLLRLGGDYHLAVVRAEDGYDIIYLSGATVNSSAWTPGMVKAHLSPSGISGVWNVTWQDAMHSPLSHDIKAQTDKNGTLSIQFPYQSSTLRFHPAEVRPQGVSGR